MTRVLHILLFVALVVTLASLAYGIDYAWLTDHELTVFGEQAHFWTGDTLQGTIRSNDCFRFSGVPAVSFDVITAAPCDSCVESDPYRTLLDYHCGYPRVEFPTQFTDLRIRAAEQGHFYGGPDDQAKAVLMDSVVQVYLWPRGTPFDSTLNHFAVTLDSGTNSIFFDCPLTVRGILQGDLRLGCSGNLGIEDNIIYADSDPRTGMISDMLLDSSRNFLTLASEADVKILNTTANGRENSAGLGLTQLNRNFSGVTIAAGVYALSSFTFEQQNDPDSGYVCIPCGCNDDGIGGGPDDRGTIYLFGGIAQGRRGYVHRSTCSSTGYLKHYRWDARWLHHYDNMGFPNTFHTSDSTTDTVNFGEVPLATTVWDTADVYTLSPQVLGGVNATWPFVCERIPPLEGTHFRVPVSITPAHTGLYAGYLNVSTEEHYFQIPLQARGVTPSSADAHILHPLSFILSVFPNPFNAMTELRLSVPRTAHISLAICDLQGRRVATLVVGTLPAGEHTILFDASALSSGLYFARLECSGQMSTAKLLLVK
jgi:hypothetical protein